MLHQDNLTLLIVQCVAQKTLHVSINTAKIEAVSCRNAPKDTVHQKKESKLDTVVQALYSVINIGESLCASITGCEIKNIICVCRVTGKRQYYRQVFMYWKSAIL